MPKGEKTKKSQGWLIQRVHELTGNEYSVLGEYINANTHVLMRHNICGCEYMVTPAKFINCGRRCSHCFKPHIKTTEQFRSEVKELVGDEYTVESEYLYSTKHIVMKHSICGTLFQTTPTHFLRDGIRCSVCSSSKGELEIRRVLTDLNVKFITEHSFKDCYNKALLKFDFYLPDFNIAIEYDGQQHFRPIKIFGGEERFKLQQQNDIIKESYCQEKMIKLIRISYKEFKLIPNIIQKAIKEVDYSTSF